MLLNTLLQRTRYLANELWVASLPENGVFDDTCEKLISYARTLRQTYSYLREDARLSSLRSSDVRSALLIIIYYKLCRQSGARCIARSATTYRENAAKVCVLFYTCSVIRACNVTFLRLLKLIYHYLHSFFLSFFVLKGKTLQNTKMKNLVKIRTFYFNVLST